MKAFRSAVIALVLLAACRSSTPPPPPIPEPFTSGEQLIGAMKNRYAGRWYRTMTFAQRTTSFGADGAPKTATWYEAALLPSRLRIDFEPISAGNGVLIRGDSQFVMQGGNLARTIVRTNELLLLGFDVYFLDPAVSAAWLTRIGFDLSKIRKDTWQGREVYVVGANGPADLQSRQFWIERERLVFVRLLQPSAGGNGAIDDIRFDNYESIGRAWIAPLVEIYNGDKLVFKEEYQEVRVDVPLDSALFIPAEWSRARHWR